MPSGLLFKVLSLYIYCQTKNTHMHSLILVAIVNTIAPHWSVFAGILGFLILDWHRIGWEFTYVFRWALVNLWARPPFGLKQYIGMSSNVKCVVPITLFKSLLIFLLLLSKDHTSAAHNLYDVTKVMALFRYSAQIWDCIVLSISLLNCYHVVFKQQIANLPSSNKILT